MSLTEAEREEIMMTCWDCRKPINPDDDANVCIECGGRNTRKEE